MDITIFFARLWGSFFLIFGALFLITKQLGRTIEMTNDKSFVISTGYITLLMGLITVILHNIWAFQTSLSRRLLIWSMISIFGGLLLQIPRSFQKPKPQ